MPTLPLVLLTLLAASDTGRIVGTIEAPVAKHRANAVVYVKTGDKGVNKPVTVRMDQTGLVFTPRVLPIPVGSTVEFLNSDPVAHNVYTIDGEPYDLGTWPKGEKRAHTFPKPGVFRQLCKVHDDMIAFVVVLDGGRFVVSDKAGAFTLEGLPPGSYTLSVWHEKLAAADVTVEVAAGVDAKLTIPLTAKK